MVGIDISDRSIKVAEITNHGAPRLRSVGWGAIPAEVVQRGFIRDVDAVAQYLQDTFLRASPVPITGKTVVASIPEVQSFISVIEVPPMSGREMDEAVRWAVRGNLPFDLERVYIDWQPLGVTPAGKTQVLVGAAQREVVDPLLQVLDGLELRVVGLELEGQSIVRSLLPVDSSGIDGVLIVDLGATSTNLIFFNQSAMRFTTSVPKGGDDLTTALAGELSIPFEQAAEQKALVGVSAGAQNQQMAGVLRTATRELVERISVVARDVSQGTRLQAILLAGGAANLPGIVEVFAEAFPGVPVQAGNPWTNLLAVEDSDKAMLSPEDAIHFATSLGLALREPEEEYV